MAAPLPRSAQRVSASPSGSRRARRIRRIRADVELVAIEVAVAVAVDAETEPGPRRRTGIRALLSGGCRLGRERVGGDRRLGGTVALEGTGRGAYPASRLARQRALDDEVAVASGRPGGEER